MPDGRLLEQLRCKLMEIVMDGKRDAKRTVGDKLDVEDEGKSRTEETANSRVLPSLLFQKHISLLCHCHYSLAPLKGELVKEGSYIVSGQIPQCTKWYLATSRCSINVVE